MIALRTLGPVEVTLDGAAAPPELLWRKNLALLLYLARSPAHRRTRDHLIGLLWGDKGESAARHSLREAVRMIRRHGGEHGVETEADQIRLADGMVALDTERFEALAAAGDWAGAARLVAGEYLEGFSVPDASPFEDWLAAERAHWRRQVVAVLGEHAECLLAGGDAARASSVAQRALALDPMSEPAARTAMKALALAGERSGALEVHRQFAARLDTLGGATPETATQALAQRLRSGREWRLPEYARAAAQRGAESRRAPLVGRERELSLSVEQWNASRRAARLRVIVLEADPGLGKSRLAEEMAARVRLDGGVIAGVRAVTADQDRPCSGILGLARGGLLDAAGVAGAQPAALASLATQVTEWADRFRAVVRETSPWPLPAAFGEILRAAGREQPVLLLVDDAQWLDEESHLVLEAVARDLQAAPITLLLAAAPHPPRVRLDQLRARIGRDVDGVAVRLAPLAPAALRELARWAFPGYQDEEIDRVARRVALDSAGLPLLAVELFHAIALGLDLHATKGAWPEPRKTLDQTLPGELPATVVAAIRVGFRRLSAPAQQALAVAAVLGERVSAAAIGRATGLQNDALNGALDELEWQRWLVAEPRGYSFVARIVREVVDQDMVTPGQRQRIKAAAHESPP